MGNIFNKCNRYLYKLCLKKVKFENQIKWGIIGTGYMAQLLSEAIDCDPDSRVAAVLSRSERHASSFAKKYKKCRAFTDIDDMICYMKNNIDVIYVATPTYTHYEYVKKILINGGNVLCEKPITFSPLELKELISLADVNKCFLMEGMWMKCLPAYRKGFEWFNQGLIGELQLVKVDLYKHEKIDSSKAIFDPNLGGGVLRDYGVYPLAFVLDFFKTLPIQIYSKARYSEDGIDTDWCINITQENVQYYINISSDFTGTSRASLIGNNGTIEWDSQFNRTNKVYLYDKYGVKKREYLAQYRIEGFEYEVSEVVTCLRQNLRESPIVPLESSMLTNELMAQLIMSTKINK